MSLFSLVSHSLGLSHSDDQRALMAPFYRGWVPNLQLNSDDISAIQALYGERQDKTTTRRPTTTRRTTQRPNNNNNNNGGGNNNNNGGDNGDLCQDSSIDTIFETDDGNYYAFRGSDYWLLTEDSVASGYPRKISDDWEGLPNNIDAAVTWKKLGHTFFFKGNQYWKFRNKKVTGKQGDYPKKISQAFRGIPNNVDSAFVWGGNGRIYFFKGRRYWKYDPQKKPPVSSSYPKPISNWDLPSSIRAASRWGRYNYFFTDDKYYRFDDRRFTISEANPSYPRPTGPWWFGCEGSNTASAKKEIDTRSLFTEEGDEVFDVYPGDEDKKRK